MPDYKDFYPRTVDAESCDVVICKRSVPEPEKVKEGKFCFGFLPTAGAGWLYSGAHEP